MHLTSPRTVLHGSSPLQTSRFSEEYIAAQNREHDAKYGWSDDCKTVYQNVARLPESVYVPASQVWKEKV